MFAIVSPELDRARAAYELAQQVFEEIPGGDPRWFVAYHELEAAKARYELVLHEVLERVRRERGAYQ